MEVAREVRRFNHFRFCRQKQNRCTNGDYDARNEIVIARVRWSAQALNSSSSGLSCVNGATRRTFLTVKFKVVFVLKSTVSFSRQQNGIYRLSTDNLKQFWSCLKVKIAKFTYLFGNRILNNDFKFIQNVAIDGNGLLMREHQIHAALAWNGAYRSGYIVFVPCGRVAMNWTKVICSHLFINHHKDNNPYLCTW